MSDKVELWQVSPGEDRAWKEKYVTMVQKVVKAIGKDEINKKKLHKIENRRGFLSTT